MPKRNSRRQSRAQKRHRRSLKGGRKEEEPKKEEGMLSGLFGSAEEKPADVSEKPSEEPVDVSEKPAEEPADVSEKPSEKPAEEPGLFSGIMGKKEEEPAAVSEKPAVNKKNKRHGKYYTNKQIDAVCAKKAKARRSRKMIKRGRRQFNNFEQPRNPYVF